MNQIIDKIFDRRLHKNNRNLEKAITMFYKPLFKKEKPESSDPDYEHKLLLYATCYNYGFFNFSFDTDQSKEYLKKVLKLNPNNMYALNMLGMIYYRDNSVPNAIDLLNKSINLGNVNSMVNLMGIFYHAKKYSDALPLLEKAIELNDNTAIIKIGSIYDQGLYGTDVDDIKAIEFYEKALYNGGWSAENLSNMYNHGRITLERITEIFQNAIKMGNKYAMFEYGELCLKNHTCIQDRLSSYAYYAMAYDAGLQDDNYEEDDYDDYGRKNKFCNYVRDISYLLKEISDLKNELNELKEVCYMPGGIVSKNCEKHFYDTSKQI